MLMIRPPEGSTRAAARAARNVPRTLTAKARSNCSSVASSSDAVS